MRSRPVLLVAAGAALLSFAPVFVKLAHVGPNGAGFYRMVFGVAGLAVVMALRRESPFKLGRKGWVGLAAGAFFACDLTLWHRSVYVVGPGLATVLANFQVFFVGAFGVLILREKLSWRLAVAIPAAMTGMSFLIGPNWSALTPAYKTGVAYGVAAAVCYSAYLLTLRKAGTVGGRCSPFATMTAVSVGALAAFLVFSLLQHEDLGIPTARDGLYLAVYGVTAQAFAWALVVKGLEGVPASRAGLVLLLQPSLAFVWDILFFGRPTTPWDIAGVAVALGAIYLGTSVKKGAV